MTASNQHQLLAIQHHPELQRVLESETFRYSDSLRRLLAYLGEEAGSSDNLKEYTIGVEAFNKPTEYDPQQDPTVRVLASKLRRKLEEYYSREGAQNPVRIEIPRGHYELSTRFHKYGDVLAGDLPVAPTAARDGIDATIRPGIGYCIYEILY